MFNFRLWISMFMVMSWVVSDAGGGDFKIDPGGDGGETPPLTETPEVPEVVTAPDTPEVPEPPEKEEPPASPETPEVTEAEEQAMMAVMEKMGFKGTMEQMQSFMTEQTRVASVNEANASLTAKYPDFDLGQVEEHLNEMAKSDPERAEMMNNPVGWENIYLTQQLEQGDGVFLAPRGVSKEPFDMAAVSEKALNGDDRAKTALFDNIK